MKDNPIPDKNKSKLIDRFKYMLRMSTLMLLVSMTFLSLSSHPRHILILMILDIFIILSLYHFTNKGNIELSRKVFLWTNILLVSYLFWNTGGLVSSSLILVFPILLMISALLASTNTFLSIISFITVLISLMGILVIGGWSTAPTPEFGYWQLSIVVMFIWASGYTAWRFNADMKNALNRLKSEVDNVNISRSQIEKLIHFDPLTSLSSRFDCKEGYSLLNERLKDSSKQITLLFLDLDNFKSINDYYNHLVGDELLRKIASRLKLLIEEDDIACRLSGDEFLLIVSRPEHYNLEQLALRILQEVSKPIEVFEHKIEGTVSIGLATQEEMGEGFESVLKRADLAMYRAKEAGKNKYSFYDDDIQKQTTRKLEITNGLRAALINEGFELYLQPKVDMKTGKITSAEALLRWVNNNPKNIGPEEFIPIIESTELICEIGEWVIRRACKLCKELHDNGFEGIPISVNISSAQFVRGGLENIIINELRRSQLMPKFLDLELTEHILFQVNDEILDELSRIKDLGVTLSIDDFGTGYSNLGYLTKFKVDSLKIDRSFVENIHKLPEHLSIVDAIIKMGKALGLKIIAEGVETNKEWDVLKQLDCDFGQGFLWSKPLPSKEFLKLASDVT